LIKENDGKTERFANQLDEDGQDKKVVLLWKLRNGEKAWGKTTHAKNQRETC